MRQRRPRKGLKATVRVDRSRRGDEHGTDIAATYRQVAGFGRLIVDETEKWAKLIRAATIKAQWVDPLDGEFPYRPFREPARCCAAPSFLTACPSRVLCHE